jgi:hypothetical protein
MSKKSEPENQFVPAEVRDEYKVAVKGGPMVVLPGMVKEIDLRLLDNKQAAYLARVCPAAVAKKTITQDQDLLPKKQTRSK